MSHSDNSHGQEVLSFMARYSEHAFSMNSTLYLWAVLQGKSTKCLLCAHICTPTSEETVVLSFGLPTLAPVERRQ